MRLTELLETSQAPVIDEAVEAMERAHLPHYQDSGAGVTRERLQHLHSLVMECLAKRDLGPICEYADALATERFAEGFDVGEVQTAFNVLEEAIWHVVVPQLPRDELAEDTGLIGTVLGAGKDALARKWVSLATSRHVATLDLSALFAGTRS